MESAEALAGVKVLDCSQLVSGPYCAKLLAGFGAEVIKIEPLKGDKRRAVALPFLRTFRTKS